MLLYLWAHLCSPVNTAIIQTDHLESLCPDKNPHFVISPSIAGDVKMDEFQFNDDRENEDKEERIANNMYTTGVKIRTMALIYFENIDGKMIRKVDFV